MPKTFIYRYLGINISSEIELPECTVTQNVPDVIIQFGKIPEHIDNAVFKGVCFEAKPGFFLIKILNIAGFYISNGDTITIEPFQDASDNLIRIFLFSNALGALLHQRQYLTIHGSAIEINGEAIIFSGVSGAGKSTIAAAMAKKGFNVIADDFSPIKFSNNTQELYTSFPMLKLWKNTIEVLGLHENKPSRIRNNIEKYFVRFNKNIGIEKLPVHRLYLIKIQNSGGIYLEPVTGMEKFTIIKDQTYRYNYLKGLELESQHFEFATKLASNITVIKIYRENKGFEIEKLVDTILINEKTFVNAS